MPSSRAPVGAGRRRSSDEIHRLLLEAASELFAEKGYAATTTREIGVRAGVPEVMLFRHFGSKASLFSEASLQPFNDFLSQFAASWGVHVDEAELDESYLQEFVGGLYELARDRRKLIIDLVSAAEYEPEILGTSGDGGPMLAGLAEIAGVGRAALARRGGGVDSELTVRAIISMVTATAVFRPLIFGGDDTDVDHDAVARDLTVMAGRMIGGPSRRR